jgi:hypothetical protein
MGYQQGGPPQGYQPAPPPAQKSPQQIDFQAILAKFTTGELVILGASILWFIFSFFGSWLSASYSCPASFGPACSSIGSVSDIGATIYHGWGWLAFLAWLALLLFFVMRKFLRAQVELPPLPVPDAYVYMGLGALMVLGTFLYWVEYHTSESAAGFSSSITFGWVWFVGVILEIAIIAGGYLTQNDPAPAVAGGASGGYGGYGGGYQQPGNPQQQAPAYPPQPPYADPSQTQQRYGAPPQQGYPQQGGYPPQQPPGYPPQQ